jgi:hypothetical protein
MPMLGRLLGVTPRACVMCSALAAVLAACAGGADGGPDGSAVNTDDAKPSTTSTAASPASGTKVAEAAAEVPLLKGESLVEPRFEFPGVPIYPNARSIAMEGIGPVMKMGGGSIATYAVTGSALDIIAWYRAQLLPNGWTEAFAGNANDLSHTTPLAQTIFTKGTKVIKIGYGDGTTEADVTGPRLSITAIDQ